MRHTLIELGIATIIDEDNPCLASRAVRRAQYIEGLTQFFKVLNTVDLPEAVDILLTDNTTEEMHPDILAVVPEGVKTVFCNNNIRGKVNKGGGLIEQWEYNKDLISAYDWFIHFEPRTFLKGPSFFQEFFTNPRNLFRCDICTAGCFYTGIFAIRSPLLLEYVRNTPTLAGKNIEGDLYKFCDGKNYDIVSNADVIWHDTYAKRDVHY